MKLYNVAVDSFFVRFHIFAALIVALGFAGYLYVGIVVGMILFLTTIMGLQFKKKAQEDRSHISIRHVHIPAHRYATWHKQHHWHRA